VSAEDDILGRVIRNGRRRRLQASFSTLAILVGGSVGTWRLLPAEGRGGTASVISAPGPTQSAAPSQYCADQRRIGRGQLDATAATVNLVLDGLPSNATVTLSSDDGQRLAEINTDGQGRYIGSSPVQGHPSSEITLTSDSQSKLLTMRPCVPATPLLDCPTSPTTLTSDLADVHGAYEAALARLNEGTAKVAASQLELLSSARADQRQGDPEVKSSCSAEQATRTLVLSTHNHSFDKSPNRSASLAQNTWWLSQDQGGWFVWYIAH
jgi:hypothetical protein